MNKKESLKDINNFYEIEENNSIEEIVDQLSSKFINNFINKTYINNILTRLDNQINTMKVQENIIVLHANANQGVIKNGYCISVGVVKGKNYFHYKKDKIKIFIFIVPDLLLQHIENMSNLISVCSNIYLSLESKTILEEKIKMKNTLIIIKCSSGLIFFQIAKKKIINTTKLKTYNAEILLNPQIEDIENITKYENIFFITNIKDINFSNSVNLTKIDLNDFISNPEKY